MHFMERYAYTDESGNSGIKLFDSGQDIFWTGTLISFAEMDSKYRTFHQELLSTVGDSELHGSKLGFSGIDKIASRLTWFIREKRLQFSFGRLDKHFLAAAKLFDLAFDSGNNPAMPTHAYGIQQLRLMTQMHFVQLLRPEDVREFWDLFQKQDAVRFGVLLGRILPRVAEVDFDTRTAEILTDVLSWGTAHPREILDKFSPLDAPNYVAFTGLFGHLHRMYQESGDTIASFVHDEQNQFTSFFETGYRVLSQFAGKDHPLAYLADWEKLPSFQCALLTKSSSQSFGLQLVDICLWLFKRVTDNGDRPQGACRMLFESLLERSWIKRFDFPYLVRQVKEGMQFVEELPLTLEDLERAQDIGKQFEANRQLRLAAVARNATNCSSLQFRRHTDRRLLCRFRELCDSATMQSDLGVSLRPLDETRGDLVSSLQARRILCNIIAVPRSPLLGE
jgi:hypothetical protein